MRLPYTGRMLAAARMLAGLEQQELAKLAKISASTISRMEAAQGETVSAHPKNIEAVLTVLERKGVVIEEDGIRLKGKRR
jgi:transcriptional regulator with XRE-family HTH domain